MEHDRDAAPRPAHRRVRRHGRRRRRRLIAALVVAAIVVGAVVAFALADGSDEEPAPPFVASSGNEPATLWAVGDSADGGARAARVARLIGQDPGQRMLYLGDVYERGTAQEFEQNYEPVYGRFAGSTAPVPGNHEWYLRDEGYRPYWESKKGRSVPDYYDFRIAGWQLIALNSEDQLEPDSEQVAWLEGRLRDARGTCRLAFWHRPRFNAGSHGDHPKVETLWRPLVGKVALVVTAHDHNMQRLKPKDGIAQYIAGAGGHSNYGVDEEDPRLEFSNEKDNGALRIALRAGKADLSFVAANGRVLDKSTVNCTR
jgi:acid phosphatase type 7